MVLKALFGKGVCRCFFSLLFFQCDLQFSGGSERLMEEDDQFGL
jgi:hypothetical protein